MSKGKKKKKKRTVTRFLFDLMFEVENFELKSKFVQEEFF